jgi:hypothetical protein
MTPRCFLRSLSLIFLAFSLGHCASKPTQTVGAIPPAEYEKLARALTQKTSQYDGFNQTFQAGATLMTTAMHTAALARRADFQKWDANKLQQERDRTFQNIASSTKVFIRFYTPNSDYDDLHLPKSMWKVYLEHEGKRYEAKIEKTKDKLAELTLLYPDFDRFNTGYEATFSVPTSAIEAGQSILTITSSLGQANFSFSP